MRNWNLDHFDAEQRGVRILRGRDASRQLLVRAHRRRSRDVDVDVLGVARIHEHGVGVRAAAGLHVGDVARMRDVGDVIDADAAQPVLADRLVHPLGAAVEPRAQILARDEEEVLVGGDVALRRGAVEARVDLRRGGVRDVPHLIAAEAALYDVVAREREIRVDPADELLGGPGLREHAQVPDRLARVPQAGLEADARIGAGRGRRRGAGCARRRDGGLGTGAERRERGDRERAADPCGAR